MSYVLCILAIFPKLEDQSVTKWANFAAWRSLASAKVYHDGSLYILPTPYQ